MILIGPIAIGAHIRQMRVPKPDDLAMTTNRGACHRLGALAALLGALSVAAVACRADGFPAWISTGALVAIDPAVHVEGQGSGKESSAKVATSETKSEEPIEPPAFKLLRYE